MPENQASLRSLVLRHLAFFKGLRSLLRHKQPQLVRQLS